MDCYKLNTAAMTWQDASAACHRDGTHLTSIVTIYEQSYIDTLTASLNSPVWIGLSDIKVITILIHFYDVAYLPVC